MKYIKKFLNLLLVTVILIGATPLYESSAYAFNIGGGNGPFGCNSGVFIETSDGSMLCIANQNPMPYGAIPNYNEFSPDQDNSVGQTFTGSDFGYSSSGFVVDTDNSSCDAFPITGPNLGYFNTGQNHAESPLRGYTGGRECSDQSSGNQTACDSILAITPPPATPTPIPTNYEQNGPPSLVADVNSPKLGSIDPNGSLACINQEVKDGNNTYDYIVCNAEVENICQSSGTLRAGFNDAYNANFLYFWCNQTSGHGADDVTPVRPNYDSNLSPPQLDNLVPPVSYCCSNAQKGGANTLENGENITDNNPNNHDGKGDSSYDEAYTKVNKTSDNLCDISKYVPVGVSGGLNPCANANYRNSDSFRNAECQCTFDSEHGVANGNTYTAFGCIPSNFGEAVNIILSIAIAFASFFAIVFMIVGAYMIMSNPTNPDRIEEGRKFITNAVLGLLLILFCIVILKILGVDILGLNILSNLFG